MFFICGHLFIMKSQSIYKVPQGKLLKISLESDNKQHIKDISISGDFFAYPEESIQKLEEVLKKSPLEKNQLFTIISHFISSNEVQFIGIDAESLTEGIMRCLDE
jgi:lipoate---protein ligase